MDVGHKPAPPAAAPAPAPAPDDGDEPDEGDEGVAVEALAPPVLALPVAAPLVRAGLADDCAPPAPAPPAPPPVPAAIWARVASGIPCSTDAGRGQNSTVDPGRCAYAVKIFSRTIRVIESSSHRRNNFAVFKTKRHQIHDRTFKLTALCSHVQQRVVCVVHTMTTVEAAV